MTANLLRHLLAVTLFSCCAAVAAESPKPGLPHFANRGQVPMLYVPMSGIEKGSAEKDALDLSGDDTEGRLSLLDEIWYPIMKVPLHYHKRHAELFYVIAGEVEWTIEGETHLLHAGELAYVPPNTPHKVHVVGNVPEYNLFISLPGGFEQQLYVSGAFTESELATPVAKALQAYQDDFNAVPDEAQSAAPTAGSPGRSRGRHFALTANTPTVMDAGGKISSKVDLNGAQTEGRFTVEDQLWQPNLNVPLHQRAWHSESFYVLGGAIEWTIGKDTRVMRTGDLVYIPPNTPHKEHVVGEQAAHVLVIQMPGGSEKALGVRGGFPDSDWAHPAAKAALDALQDIDLVPDKQAAR